MASSGSEHGTLEPAGSVGTKSISGLKGLGGEVVLIAAAMLLYFGIRNLTAGNADTAFLNADRLMELERWLGIDWEAGLQNTTVGSDAPNHSFELPQTAGHT